jgi:phage terminase large subunit-like protein
MAMSPPERPSAAEVIAWIRKYCVAPEGPRLGQPLELADYQVDFITAVFDNPVPTRRGILSVGRKGGKSTLCACLILVYLCGPGARRHPNAQLYSAARSRDQAGLIFDLMVKMIRLKPELAEAVKVHETAKMLTCPERGTRYRALSSETSTAHGLAPQLVVHDELGRARGPDDELFRALESATGSLIDPLSIIISTQAASDDDLLSRLIDDGLAGADPRVVVRLYSAPAEADPFSLAAIEAANPGLDRFMNRDEVLRMANEARRMSGSQASFKNLVLNQRVDVSAGAQFVTREIWLVNGAKPRDLHYCRVYAGLDMSSTGDITAFVLAGLDPVEADWSVKVHAFLPRKGLDERAAGDRELYRKWVDEGLLELVPGGAIDPAFVAKRVVEIIAEYPNFQRCAYDRWGMEPFLRALEDLMSADEIAQKFVPHGQGFKDMPPSIAALERVLLDGKLRHGGNLVLNAHIANTVVVLDDAGGKKFSKKRARGRIDAIVALAMAIGCSSQKGPPKVDVASLIG